MESEIDVLDRTLLRLGSLEDEQLTPILEKVLPRLLPLLNRHEAPIRNKCIEVLDHIQKRCQNQDACHVPLAQLIDLYKMPSFQGTLIFSFLIRFIEIGFDSADPSERVSLLNSILDHISEKPPIHRSTLIKIIVSALPYIVFSNDPLHNRSMFPSLLNKPDKQWLLTAFRDILLLHPRSQSTSADEPPNFGFSQQSWEGVGKIDRSIGNLKTVKLSVVRFLTSSGIFEASDVFILGLIASSDSSGEVVDLGESMYRRLGKPEMNNAEISSQLLSLYLGDQLHRGANPQLKMQIIPMLCKSTYAAQNMFPSLLKVVFDSAFGGHSVIKLTRYGMELLTFALRHGASQNIQLAGNALLASLLKLFQRFNEQSVAGIFYAYRIRGLVYDAIANLISVHPAIAVNATQIPTFFFRMLQKDVDEVRGDLRASSSLLATVYSQHSPLPIKAQIKKMLITNCLSFDSIDAVRQCSLDWLNRLFPFSDVESRHIALLMIADPSAEVRESAQKSLLPQGRAHEYGSEASPVAFPKFREMMSYLIKKDALLSESAAVLRHMIVFLRMCLYLQVQRKNHNLNVLLTKIRRKDSGVFDSFVQFLFNQFDKKLPNTAEVQNLRFEASSTLLQIVKACPEMFLQEISQTRLGWTIDMVATCVEEGTRSNFAQLLGLIFSSQFVDLNLLRSTLTTLTTQVKNGSKDNNLVHGCCLGIGYVVGSCVKSGCFPTSELTGATRTMIDLLDSTIPLVCSGACMAVSTVCSMGRLPINENEVVYSKIITRLQQLARACQMESMVSETAILALGHVSGFRDQSVTEQVIEALLSLSNIRQDDLLFATGDALVQCCLTAKNGTVVRTLLKRLLEGFIRDGSAISRCSGAIWSLFIVNTFLPSFIETDENYADTIQASLSTLLNDSRVLTQECASKAMAVVFQKCSTQMKDDLIRELLRSVPSAKVQTEGEESSVKEFFTIAKELGKPSLVYQLLDVSCSHHIWSSKYGARFVTNSFQQISSVLQPNISAVIPKLYRYQYDPIPQIRKTMKAVYPIDSTVVTENFGCIIQDLITCMLDRDARIRQSSCAALHELISGRSFQLLSPYLESMFRNVFLILDDLKDSVRAAALSLSVSLSSILERICDVSLSPPSLSSKAISAVLPVLLDNGMQSRSKEVNSTAVITLVRLINASGPMIVPHIPQLLRVLLEALSSMEDQVLNYAMFHTATLNVTQEQLEAVRLSLSKSSPVSGALQICFQHVDDSVLNQVVDILTDILNQGTGLPTMDGTAQFVSVLVNRLPISMALHAHNLIRVLLQCIGSAGPSIRKSVSVTLSQVANIANDDDISLVTARIEKLYFKDELELSAMICKEMVERIDAAKLRVHCSKLLPICYVGRYSSEPSASALWTQCLEESSLGIASTIRNFSDDIVKFIVTCLCNSSYECKKSASLAVFNLVTVAELTTAKHFDALYEPLLTCISCPIWTGKSAALKAFMIVIKTCVDIVRTREIIPKIIEIFQNECCRSDDIEYQRTVFAAIQDLSETYRDIDFLSFCFPVVQKLLSGEVSIDISVKTEQVKLLSGALKCLSSCWNPSSVVPYADIALLILRCIRGQELAVQSAALTALEQLFTKSLESVPVQTVSPIINDLIPILESAIRDSKHESIRSPALDVLLVLIARGTLEERLANIEEFLRNIPHVDSTTVMNKRQQILILIGRKFRNGA